MTNLQQSGRCFKCLRERNKLPLSNHIAPVDPNRVSTLTTVSTQFYNYQAVDDAIMLATR